MKNRELASMFQRIADSLEFKGDIRFKINAYKKVARVLFDMTEDIGTVCKEGRLRDIPGIGEAIAKKIDEYLKTGRMKKYEEVMEEVPEELLMLMEVSSIGPKTLRLAYNKLDVKNKRDLLRVMDNGSLAGLAGMGEKKIEKMKKAIQAYEKGHERISIGDAVTIVDEVLSYLKKRFPKIRFTPCGSLRRMKETVGDIDITAGSSRNKEIINVFKSMPSVSELIGAGDTKASVMIPIGRHSVQIDLRVVPEDSYGACIQYFTGSKPHNVHLRTLAVKKGLKLSEYGVYRDEKRIAGRTEEDVYRILDLPWIPPEIREDTGEIDAAIKGVLPKLIEYSDIKGDLHIHSNYSDGTSTILEIAKKAKELDYEYICITDHSERAKYAGGLSLTKLKERNELCKQIEQEQGIRIFRGIELELVPGHIEYPEELIRELDIITLAIHHRKEGYDFTRDVISTFSFIHVFAHPTGRLLSGRSEYKIDLKTIFQEAAKNNVLMEINGYPDRLDLSDVNVREAKKYGTKFSICSDAHSRDKLNQMKFGVGTARRGWAEKEDVINTFSLNKVENWLENKKFYKLKDH
ncbi:DNA polymerase/3'-5' exonuclease PolX [candidate division WOR-3 bacterium]|nr:DNA polymerase/3'-5' exonuclease PolX [candidate division WOR-3 bacterium]